MHLWIYYRAVFKGVKAPLFLHYSTSETSLLTLLWQSASARIFFVPTMANGSGKRGIQASFSEKHQFQSKIAGGHQKPKWVQNAASNLQFCRSSQLFSTTWRTLSPRIAPTKAFYTSGMKPVKSFNSLVLNTCPVAKYTITHVSSVLLCVFISSDSLWGSTPTALTRLGISDQTFFILTGYFVIFLLSFFCGC